MYLVLDREASWWCAGVTLGLMASESSKGLEQWELIADTSSLEEGLGPMQLHAAGSAGGFTALQLVCNRPGSPPPTRQSQLFVTQAELQASCCGMLRK